MATLQELWCSVTLLNYNVLLTTSQIIYNAPQIMNPAKQIDLTFPDDFLIGSALSSYQAEGAWNVSGKSENNWDHDTHKFPERIRDKSNGDVSSDFYHKYKEDIQSMKNIGMNHFRFSISWSRILPTGSPDSLNQSGLDYYHNILNELENKGIVPFVTIYHWDHPQSLARWGGWMNEKMVGYFADYARVVFREFGPRVKIFSTINEPYIYCRQMYKVVHLGPNSNVTNWGQYDCIHNMLKAHAEAYHIYHKEFRREQNGEVGIPIPCYYYYSKNKNDFESNVTAFEFECGMIANPIFTKEGDYPEIVKRKMRDNSISEGLTKSKLPTFSKEWIDKIKGTSDYFGLNHYTSFIVEPLTMEKKNQVSSADSDSQHYQSIKEDEGLLVTSDERWHPTAVPSIRIAPKGFGDLLRLIKDKYNNPKIYVLENGAPDVNAVNDETHKDYFYHYMKEMLIAMKRDKCNIKVYTIWSFLDSYEWVSGYTLKFGLVNVDMNHSDRTRTPKASVIWLKSVLQSRKLLPYN